MRGDEDQIRHFMPVLRRIIILVAVLTAIPVVMWTITAFVRTYVGPPKAPMYQRVVATRQSAPAATPATAATNSSPATDEAKAAPQPLNGDDTASTAGAGANPPASASTAAAATPDAAPSVASPATTNAASAAAAPAPPAAPPTTVATASADTTGIIAANPPARGGASQAPDNAEQHAPQQPAANWPAPPAGPAANAVPSGEPIGGQVPLPLKRPRTFVVAQTSVPLPMPRPDAAGPGAPAPSATPLDWLHNILQPQSAPAATPSSGGDNEIPH